MLLEEWISLTKKLRNHADSVASMYRERAKELCRESGLDETLLGIHPHNAMCSFESGNPWPNVDYNKVKLCLWFLDNQWLASREADKLISQLYKEVKFS